MKKPTDPELIRPIRTPATDLHFTTGASDCVDPNNRKPDIEPN